MHAFRSSGLLPPKIPAKSLVGSALMSSLAPTEQVLEAQQSFDLEDLPRDDESTKENVVKEEEESSIDELRNNEESIHNPADEKEENKSSDSNLISASIHLLSAFTPDTPGPSDPVLALTMFYQKNGIISTKEYFQEHKAGNDAFWFSFTCPLNGVEYTSALPRPLFELPLDDRLINLASNIFGTYMIKRDQVIFTTKKGAKRSVAYAILEAHQQTGITPIQTTLMVSATEAGNAVHQGVEISMKESKKISRKSFPTWVHKLYSMGVSPNSLEISYRQHGSISNELLSACQLCCIISCRQPRQLTAISLPCTSKRLAMENAVLLLTEELKRTESSLDSSAKGGQSDLAKIQQCNPKNAIYLKPLPPWSNAAMKKTATLYRIQFLTTVGTNFVASRSGLGLDVLTSFGVIFFSPLPSAIKQVQAVFELPSLRQDKHEKVTVRLSNPISVDLATHSCESIEFFNRKIHLWKDYGQQSSSIDGIEMIGPDSNKSTSRTYMFVPLKKEELWGIDWDLIRRIRVHKTIPYLTGIDHDWCIPLFGEVNLLFFSAVLGLTSLVILIPDIILAGRGWISGATIYNMRILNQTVQNVIGTIFAVLSLMALAALFVWPPKKKFLIKELQNRFFVEHKPGARSLHVTPSKDNFNDPLRFFESDCLTGRSKACNPKGPIPSESVLESNLRKHNLDLRTASLAELYRKKFGITIRYPGCRLLRGIPLKRHPEQDFLFIANKESPRKLIPELVHILPMPRDALYMLRHANVFMPVLEQAIEFETLANRFSLALTSKLPIEQPTNVSHNQPNLVSRLFEALGADTFQRLEFLGDSVLGYFLALNLMARNSSLAWDADDLSRIISDGGKNTNLYDAALHIGAGGLLRTGRAWHSVCQTNKAEGLSRPLEMMQAISCSLESSCHIVKITDKAMSDIVESLLGAVFLTGDVVWLLEKLRIPITGEQSSFCKEAQSTLPWFRATSPCVGIGYNFGEDKIWQARMIEIGTSLYCDKGVTERLEKGYEGLVSLMVRLSEDENLEEKLTSRHSKLLLLCALFDDSLQETLDEVTSVVDLQRNTVQLSAGSVIQQPSSTSLDKGILGAALLRDTLTMVGSYAMQLCITTDLFHRYPNATEGDLHILRACAMSHDVEVYIMFKAGIHKLLFDQGAKAIEWFESVMEMADVLGKAEWSKRGGWILHGGASEFAFRSRNSRRAPSDDPYHTTKTKAPKPLYYGLAGGRLRGQNGKVQKLPDHITSDLRFSMNAIIGALVLSIGLEDMWKCIGPLFDEVMLLDPTELRREYGALSSIVR